MLEGLGYRAAEAACRFLPCPSAAARRAVGPQPIRDPTTDIIIIIILILYRQYLIIGSQVRRESQDKNT